MTDLYEVLQVQPTAHADVIRAAYRALARRYHPDNGGDNARMTALNEAWHVLGDVTRRAAYDIVRKQPSPTPSAHQRDVGRSGRPGSGSVLDFGRYAGWSVGELADSDPDYLEWLTRTPIGRPYSAEINAVLGARTVAAPPAPVASRRRSRWSSAR